MRKKHFLIYGLFAAVLLVFFWKLAILQEAFLSGDHREQQYPWAKFYQEQIRQFMLPWWTSDIHSGFPLLAEGQIGAFYPLNYLFFLLLPLKAAYNWIILFQYWLGAVFFFLFLRRLKLDIFPSFFASLIYLFGSTQGGYFYYNFISQKTVIWLPLTLILIDRLSETKKWKDAFWLGALFAVQMFAGYLQIAIYSVLYSVLYFVWAWLKEKSPRFLTVFTCAGILGIFFSLCQLLPTLELSFLSSRSGAEKGLAYVGSMNPAGLATLFYPSWDGFLSSEFYLSLLGVFFLLYALFTKKLHREKFFIFAAIFFLLLGLGKFSPLYRLLVEGTGFNGFRTPIKFLFFVSFSCAVLCAYGLQKFQTHFSEDGFKKSARVYAFLTVVFLILPAAGTFILKNNRQTLVPKFETVVVDSFYGKAGHPHTKEYYQQKAGAFYDTVTRTLSFGEPDTKREWTYLAAAMFFILFLVPRLKKQAAFPVILTVILLADLYAYGGTSIRSNQEKFDTIDGRNRNLIVETIQNTPGLFRVMEIYTEGKENRIFPIFPCFNMLYGIQDIGAYSPLVMKDYKNFLKGWGYINNSLEAQTVLPSEVLNKMPWLGLMNVKYILSTRELASKYLVLKNQESGVYLYENGLDAGRAYFVPDQSEITRFTDFLNSERIPVAVKSYGQQFLESEFKAPSDGWFVVTDIYYDNWKARVNGKDASITKAADLFRAVPVKAGDVSLQMKYEPVLYRNLFYAAFAVFLTGAFFILTGHLRKP